MKRLILFFSIITLLCTNTLAQNSDPADKLASQAQTFLAQKEFTKARYLFLKAYEAYGARQNFEKAVECGVQTAALYYKENYYKESFDLCRGMEQKVLVGEQQSGKQMPALRYKINKVRYQMYVAMKRPAQSKQFLDVMRSFSIASKNEETANDYLYTEATYYYTFGMAQQGDNTFKGLIAKYKSQKNYQKVSECYKTLIRIGVKSNNAGLVAQTYDKYIVWTDSAKALTAKDELSVMKRKFDESQQTVLDKENSLSTKKYIIVALSIVIAILAGALILGAILLMRFMLLTRKQKKAIEIAKEHNELKSKFIQNISAQMEPTLNTMDASHPGVKALLVFSEHIQELSALENTIAEGFEASNIELSSFCEATINKAKGKVSKNITTTVESPRLNIKSNPEQLEHILSHLLNNALEHTPEGGKIWLEVKKRGAHTYQFIVTDTGKGIPAEAQENLFKPFTDVRDLSGGDGLGLPICALIATKLNGSLTLDKTYTKGCRFVLELHPA
ncbi:MAG: ATP-binding protein [Bacteroidales bacterium 45-6]|nr:MAG: ATP-binding protein [Bacteroidales bacterium 45-6]